MKTVPLVVLALLAFASSALACGYCVEDKIAAVYDHAAVTQAKARKHTVVYFAIDGVIRDSPARLAKIVHSVPGVQKGSARVSAEFSALAVSFDPRATTLPALQSSLEKALKPRGLELLLLDTMR
ncbi:MAG TPA: hypothetical protein VF211_16000 [Burkholderiales bacterium]